MSSGILYGLSAYLLWGLFPLFFKQLQAASALEVVLHRMVWSLVFVFIVLAALRRFAWLGEVRRSPALLGKFVVSALLLAGNWLTYIWAVNNGHVLDASLGYFILPLINVALGFVFLHERPRKAQWLAFALAAGGVLWMAVQSGHVPWLALLIALTFGFYGLMRKVAVLGALEGMSLETLLLAPFALAALLWGHHSGQLPAHEEGGTEQQQQQRCRPGRVHQLLPRGRAHHRALRRGPGSCRSQQANRQPFSQGRQLPGFGAGSPECAALGQAELGTAAPRLLPLPRQPIPHRGHQVVMG